MNSGDTGFNSDVLRRFDLSALHFLTIPISRITRESGDVVYAEVIKDGGMIRIRPIALESLPRFGEIAAVSSFFGAAKASALSRSQDYKRRLVNRRLILFRGK